MASPSKRKGDGFEREVVALLNFFGIPASRVPLSGALGGEHSGDVRVVLARGRETIECKRRKRSFGQIVAWLGGHYALVIRDDRCEPLVIMRLKDWAVAHRAPLPPPPSSD